MTEVSDIASDEPLQEAISKSNELIDATQNAIIGAAENVTNIIDSATGKLPAPTTVHAEPFYVEIEFWVGVAFVLTIVILAKPVLKYMGEALRRRIRNTAQSIEDAVKLRDDAQLLLAEYERKYLNAADEAAQITKTAAENLHNLEQREKAKFEESARIQERDAQKYFELSVRKIKTQLSETVSKKAKNLAEKAIRRYIAETDKSKMVDDAIKELDKFIS
ncbi:MAG: hypothetical protein IJ778_04395 [Alphaproteobacteria bacterium]|nr:hypothetical protein [Alphaproteobacteria bacterium]